MTHSLTNKRIFIAGHRGMVGGALMRRLALEDCTLLTAGRESLDLLNQQAVQRWMMRHRPDVVVLAAAKVGGILANSTYPAHFIYENITIASNVIHAAHLADVPRLMYLGSSCIYPKMSPQPMREEYLLTGPLEPTNEWYAIAKIAGIKLVQAYRKQFGRDWISAMPTNLYGPGDNYNPDNSHVLPALLRKFHNAKQLGDKEVVVWGSGTPLREFMHCDDLADALVFLLKGYSEDMHINVGSGDEVSIAALAQTIADVLGCSARLVFDSEKPDGTPRKLMDTSRLHALGWRNVRPLRAGIADAYSDFLMRGLA
jgi:GDP-L-fucose synthase